MTFPRRQEIDQFRQAARRILHSQGSSVSKNVPNYPSSGIESPMSKSNNWESLLGLTEDQAFQRKREWNRGPLTDLFPRIPNQALERILDICIGKGFTYNLSESKRWSARRLTSIVIAHVRHAYSEYDKLLREERVERYEARKQTSAQVWKVLRDWCPWDESNDVLEKTFQATLLRPEERDSSWDPMDIDSDSDVEEYKDDPMDLD